MSDPQDPINPGPQPKRSFKLTYSSGGSRGLKEASEYHEAESLERAMEYGRSKESRLSLKLTAVTEEKETQGDSGDGGGKTPSGGDEKD